MLTPSEFTIHLPSNVQPNRFPNNTASAYSTQLDQPIHLDGEWEVALTELSYPNSINLFHNCSFKFTTKRHDFCLLDPSQGGHLKRLEFILPEKFTAETICTEMNAKSDGVFTLSYSSKHYFKLEVHKSDKMLRLTTNLMSMLNFGVADFVKGVYFSKEPVWGEKPTLWHTCYVSTDACFEKKLTVIKASSDAVETLSALKKKLRRVSSPYFKLELQRGRVKWSMKEVEYGERPIAIKMNKSMRTSLGFTKFESVLHGGVRKQVGSILKDGVTASKSPWHVYVITHKEGEANVTLFDYKELKSPRTHQMKDILNSINEWSDDHAYLFEAQDDGKLKLSLRGKSALNMDNNVSRILGYTQTEFRPNKTYMAEYPVALFNNIDYVFVYCNICDHVNIGHMKSPLLHALPFHSSQAAKLVHHTVTNPIYRPFIGNVLERIDIRLCDGNGQDIEFGEGKTMLVLRLRRKLF